MRKRQQVETAALQDEIVMILYSACPDLAFHGGTCIWRCFSGKRFSSDLDFYSDTFQHSISKFERETRARGLSITKMKDTGSAISSNITNGRANVKLEINHAGKVAGTMTSYELIDGSRMEILSLAPE